MLILIRLRIRESNTMGGYKQRTLRVISLILICTVVAVQTVGVEIFLRPSTDDWPQNNLVWQLGSSQTIKWITKAADYSIALYQGSGSEGVTSQVGTIYSSEKFWHNDYDYLANGLSSDQHFQQ